MKNIFNIFRFDYKRKILLIISKNQIFKKMIIPVRCFTCGKVVAHLWEPYLEKVQKIALETRDDDQKYRFVNVESLREKTKEGRVLDELGVKKYCCRRMMLCNVDLMEKL
jgi:DNA-directed RNA polymerase subunit N (RpoN/RPB10)